MADGKKDIAIRAGIDPGGADEIGKAADKALAPWQQGAVKVGAAIKNAFQGAVTDMGRAVLVGNAINFSQALDSARKYREEIGRLSAVSGPVGTLRAQVREIGSMHLLRDSEIVAADRGLGRMTYNAKGALQALGGLQDAALATGESLEQKLPLGAALMGGLQVAGSEVASEMDRIRGLSDRLGTAGGLLAAEDRLKSMSGLLGEIGIKADRDRATFEAMALGLGKGLAPKAGERVAGNIMGALSNNRETFAALSGMKISALTDDQGNLRMDNAFKAAERVQSWVRRQSKDRGMQQMIAASLFGGDRQSGAAFLNANFAEIGAAARANPHSDKTRQEAEAFRKSDAGQAIGRQIQMERTARETAEGMLPIADAAQSVMAAHPIAGGILGSAGVNLAGQGFGALLGKIGQTLIGSGDAIKAGGAAAGGSMAAGGAAAGASLKAGALGKLGPVGAVVAAGAAGYAVGTAVDEATGLSDAVSGADESGRTSRKSIDDSTLVVEMAENRKKREADRRARAKKILSLAGKTKDENPNIAADASLETNTAAGDDVALKRLAAGAKSGTVDVTGLNPGSVAMIRDAIKEGFSTIKIENHSENPIAVNNQQHAGSMSN